MLPPTFFVTSPARLLILALALSLGAGLRAEETESGSNVAALMRKAQAGDLAAQLEVSEHFLINATADTDDAPKRDFKQVEKWLLAAALKGSAPAARLLGELLYHDYPGVPGNRARALAAFQKAAQGGDVQAMLMLAGVLTSGAEGVQPDLAKAEEWMKKAAETAPEGSPECDQANRMLQQLAEWREADAERAELAKQAGSKDPAVRFELGQRLLSEAGSDKELNAAAVEHLRFAAEAGHAAAQDAYGTYLEQSDRAAGFAWRLKAAESGLDSAQSYAALVLMRGSGPIPADPTKGLDLAVRAQLQGEDLVSRTLNGPGYFPGLSAGEAQNLAYSAIPADRERLFAAAARGEPAAQHWLARGPKPEPGAITRWVALAAKQEYPGAQFSLAIAYFNGDEVPRDHAQSAAWKSRAALLGYPEAQQSLAYHYLAGDGVPANPALARYWFERVAASSAFIDGHRKLAREQAAAITAAAAPPATALAEAKTLALAARVPAFTPPKLSPEELRAAAEKGDAESMYQLGLADIERRQIESNKNSGPTNYDPQRNVMDFRWIMSAARAGHPGAQFLAGTHWLSAETDAGKKAWLEKAAAQGHDGAKQKLAAAPTKPAVPAPTLEDYRQRAAQGDADAAFGALKLRVMQISQAITNKTAAASPAQAYGHIDTEMSQWVGLLMKTVHVDGLTLVCMWLETTQPAYAAQALYFRREIAAIHPHLAFDSGKYYDGLARRASWEAFQTRLQARLGAGELAKIEKKAADTFKAPATLDLIAYSFLIGAGGYPKDETTAFRLYQTAATAGFAQAQFNLGICYFNGRGVAADPAAGLVWFEKAAAQGYELARKQLAVLANEKSNADPLDLAHINPEVLRDALAGDPNIQHGIGSAWFEGKGLPQNYERAYYWFGRAAELGLLSARHNLGVMHAQGKGRPVDDTAAYGHFLQAAEKGLDVSQFNVGVALWHGKGVSRDPLAAHDWIKRALDQGHGPAKEVYAKISADPGLQLLLAQRNEQQAGSTLQQAVATAVGAASPPVAAPNRGKALYDQAFAARLKGKDQEWVRLLEEAGNAGYPRAMVELSLLYLENKKGKGDLAKGRAWLEKAAATRDEWALAELKQFKERFAGTGSWELALGDEASRAERFEESRKFWEQAAAQGETQAMINLGHLNSGELMYADEDVVLDLPQARAWYRKAAEAGLVRGMLFYGEYLRDAVGGAPDLAQARQWFDRALAATTDEDEKKLIRQALASLEGQTLESAEILGASAYRAKDHAKAIEWWKKASALGSSNASFDLGTLYEKGESVPVNLPEALRWYEKAAEQGHRGAGATVGELREKMKLPPNPAAAASTGGSISDAMLSFIAPAVPASAVQETTPAEPPVPKPGPVQLPNLLAEAISPEERANSQKAMPAMASLQSAYHALHAQDNMRNFQEVSPLEAARQAWAKGAQDVARPLWLKAARAGMTVAVVELHKYFPGETVTRPDYHTGKPGLWPGDPGWEKAYTRFEELQKQWGQSRVKPGPELAALVEQGLAEAAAFYATALCRSYVLVAPVDRPDEVRGYSLLIDNVVERSNQAINLGHAEAAWRLRAFRFFPGATRDEAIRLAMAKDEASADELMRAAKNGEVEAQVVLASKIGRTQPELGLYWLGCAVRNGHAGAELAIAALYAQGRNVPADSRQVFCWLARAALKGQQDAQIVLGDYLAGKFGGEARPGYARFWYERAAAFPREGDYLARLARQRAAGISAPLPEVEAVFAQARQLAQKAVLPEPAKK